MNLTVDKLLGDAKMLLSRLETHDNSAKVLVDEASSLNQEIDAHNAYQETLQELNQAAGHKARSDLIMEIQQENCAIRSLQHENNELCQMLKDQQNALELIMKKYREQNLKFQQTQDLHSDIKTEVTAQATKLHVPNHKMKVTALVDKVYEMANIMNKALEADDLELSQENEELSRLKLENQGLNELLLISKGHLGAKLIKDASTDEKDFIS